LRKKTKATWFPKWLCQGKDQIPKQKTAAQRPSSNFKKEGGEENQRSRISRTAGFFSRTVESAQAKKLDLGLNGLQANLANTSF
jgi:hypothetical protein